MLLLDLLDARLVHLGTDDAIDVLVCVAGAVLAVALCVRGLEEPLEWAKPGHALAKGLQVEDKPAIVVHLVALSEGDDHLRAIGCRSEVRRGSVAWIDNGDVAACACSLKATERLL